jgi:hypothetical protein
MEAMQTSLGQEDCRNMRPAELANGSGKERQLLGFDEAGQCGAPVKRGIRASQLKLFHR